MLENDIKMFDFQMNRTRKVDKNGQEYFVPSTYKEKRVKRDGLNEEAYMDSIREEALELMKNMSPDELKDLTDVDIDTIEDI